MVKQKPKPQFECTPCSIKFEASTAPLCERFGEIGGVCRLRWVNYVAMYGSAACDDESFIRHGEKKKEEIQ
jgi:hypothetical protein